MVGVGINLNSANDFQEKSEEVFVSLLQLVSQPSSCSQVFILEGIIHIMDLEKGVYPQVIFEILENIKKYCLRNSNLIEDIFSRYLTEDCLKMMAPYLAQKK